MLPPLSGTEREIQDQLGVQRVSDTAKRREAGFVVTAFEPRDRRLRHAATSTRLRLREPVLDPERHELAGELLERVELLERCLVLGILAELSRQGLSVVSSASVSSILPRTVVSHILRRLRDNVIEISVVGLVKPCEEHESFGVLQIQNPVLLPGEPRPQLPERRALDRARVGEAKPRTEDLEPPDRLPHLGTVLRRQADQELEHRNPSCERLVEPDLPSIAGHLYTTTAIISQMLSEGWSSGSPPHRRQVRCS